MSFLEHYGKSNCYLTNDKLVVDEILSRYVVSLLDGTSGCNKIKIAAGTAYGYLAAINKHYTDHEFDAPFSRKVASKTARILEAHKSFEKEPARRAPLGDLVMMKLRDLSHADGPLGFRATAFDYVAIGRYSGHRSQEFCMNSKTEILYYVMPDGSKVVRAFQLRNLLFFDRNDISVEEPLGSNRGMIRSLGLLYDVQKNRVNNQLVKYMGTPDHPDFCPKERALSICSRVRALGFIDPATPACIYQDGNGQNYYLCNEELTKYLRFVKQLVHPNISAEELKLVSVHSIRVEAAVILHEAGKDGPFIKLRLRWLSNCYEVYLRNTKLITQQHAAVFGDVNKRMDELAISLDNLNIDVSQSNGILDEMVELNDDD